MTAAHLGMIAEDRAAGMTDRDLREQLRDSLNGGPESSLKALESRVMAQWCLRSFGPLKVGGDVLALPGGQAAKTWGLAVVVLILGLSMGWMRVQKNQDLNDLMQPDVLSIVSIDEF